MQHGGEVLPLGVYKPYKGKVKKGYTLVRASEQTDGGTMRIVSIQIKTQFYTELVARARQRDLLARRYGSSAVAHIADWWQR